MTTPPFVFERSARTKGTALIVVSIWIALFAAWLWLEAATWIILLVALFTLPALIDLLRNPHSGLHLSTDKISWHSGRRHAEISLSEIDHVRLNTRLDFSVRVTVVLNTGRKIRIPFESTPPHQALEDALQAAGLKTQRHHFQLLQ